MSPPPPPHHPNWPKITLFDDPDEELRVEAMRDALRAGTFEEAELYLGTQAGFATLIANPPRLPQRFDSHGLETDDGSGPFEGLKRYARATRNAPASADQPYLRYDHAFPRPNPRPLPSAPEMPVDGPLGPATMNPHLFPKRQQGPVSQGLETVKREFVGQAIGGVSDAVHNTLRAFPGVEELEKYTGYQQPKFGQAETAGGTLVRDTARFLTGFIPIVRAAKLVGLGSVTAAGLAEALTRNPIEESLADLINQHRELREPVNGFIKEMIGIDLSDSTAMRRVENGLTSALLGMGLNLTLMKGVHKLAEVIALGRRVGKTAEELILDTAHGAAHAVAENAAHHALSHHEEPHASGEAEP